MRSPLHHFFAGSGPGLRKSRSRGVSELYASVLMIGVTLSFGSVVVASAVSQLNVNSNTASAAASLQASSSGIQVSLIYGTVGLPGSGGCSTVYRGFAEGTGYTLVLFNYGSVAFTPIQVFDNGTLLSGGPYSTLPPGTMFSYSLTLSCAHPAGQVFSIVDANGVEVQVAT